TVDRIVELAVRNQVKVPGIAAWDEICRAINQEPRSEVTEEQQRQMDDVFAQAIGVNAARDGQDDEKTLEEAEKAAKTDEAKINIRDMTVPMKMRLATLGNSFDRAVLIRDTKKMVALAAIKAPGVTDSE